MKVWYLPLEPYRERYTEQLLGWTEAAFARAGVPLETVLGARLGGTGRIATGAVLDAHGRCYWALTQVARLVTHLPAITGDDWVLLDDLFTPGYEALPYVFDQTGVWPRVAVRNWAQSVDPDDFTYPMRRWMRGFERIIDRTATVVLVGASAHRELWENAGFGAAPVNVVGLPFDAGAVRAQRAGPPRPWAERPRRVVYSSRLDREKQPHLFMDVVERVRAADPSVEFVLCTGSDAPRSNDLSALGRLGRLAAAGELRVEAGLTKAAYYATLGDARVQLNTARQDFVSFTALEASAFGVPTLAPAFRAFPEALENRRSQLFVPWSADDATQRLLRLLDAGEPDCVRLAAHHTGTLARTIDILRS